MDKLRAKLVELGIDHTYDEEWGCVVLADWTIMEGGFGYYAYWKNELMPSTAETEEEVVDIIKQKRMAA